jgi:hypothetical protein
MGDGDFFAMEDAIVVVEVIHAVAIIVAAGFI